MMKSGGGTAKVISGKKRRVMKNGRRVSGIRKGEKVGVWNFWSWEGFEFPS